MYSLPFMGKKQQKVSIRQVVVLNDEGNILLDTGMFTECMLTFLLFSMVFNRTLQQQKHKLQTFTI